MQREHYSQSIKCERLVKAMDAHNDVESGERKMHPENQVQTLGQREASEGFFFFFFFFFFFLWCFFLFFLLHPRHVGGFWVGV